MLDFNKLYPKKRTVSGEKVPSTEPIRDAVQEGRSGQRPDTVLGTEDFRADGFREQADSDSTVNRKVVVKFDEKFQPPMTAEQKKKRGTSSANKSSPQLVTRREYVFTTGGTATFTDYSRNDTIINEGEFSNREADAQVKAFEKKGANVRGSGLSAGTTRTDDQIYRPVKKKRQKLGLSIRNSSGLDRDKAREFLDSATAELNETNPDARLTVSKYDGRQRFRDRTPSPLLRLSERPAVERGPKEFGLTDGPYLEALPPSRSRLKKRKAIQEGERGKKNRRVEIDPETLSSKVIGGGTFNKPSSKTRASFKKPKAPNKKRGPTPPALSLKSLTAQIKESGLNKDRLVAIAERKYELEENEIPRLKRELAVALNLNSDPRSRTEGERRRLSDALKESNNAMVDGRGGEGIKSYERSFEEQQNESLTGKPAKIRDRLLRKQQELRNINIAEEVQVGDNSGLRSRVSTSGMQGSEINSDDPELDGTTDDSRVPDARRKSTTLSGREILRAGNSPTRRPHPVVALARAMAIRDMPQPGLALGSETRGRFDSAARQRYPFVRDEERAVGLADIREQQRASRSPVSTEASPTPRRARGRASDPARELSLLMGQIGQSSDPRGNKGLVKAVYEGLIEEGYSRNEALELLSNQIRGGGNDISMPEINEPSYSRGYRDDSLRSLMGRGEMGPVVGNQRSIKRPDASTMRANFGLPSRMPSQRNETRMLSQLINSGIDPEDAKKFILKLLRRGR